MIGINPKRMKKIPIIITKKRIASPDHKIRIVPSKNAKTERSTKTSTAFFIVEKRFFAKVGILKQTEHLTDNFTEKK